MSLLRVERILPALAAAFSSVLPSPEAVPSSLFDEVTSRHTAVIVADSDKVPTTRDDSDPFDVENLVADLHALLPVTQAARRSEALIRAFTLLVPDFEFQRIQAHRAQAKLAALRNAEKAGPAQRLIAKVMVKPLSPPHRLEEILSRFEADNASRTALLAQIASGRAETLKEAVHSLDDPEIQSFANRRGLGPYPWGLKHMGHVRDSNSPYAPADALLAIAVHAAATLDTYTAVHGAILLERTLLAPALLWALDALTEEEIRSARQEAQRSDPSKGPSFERALFFTAFRKVNWSDPETAETFYRNPYSPVSHGILVRAARLYDDVLWARKSTRNRANHALAGFTETAKTYGWPLLIAGAAGSGAHVIGMQTARAGLNASAARGVAGFGAASVRGQLMIRAAGAVAGGVGASFGFSSANGLWYGPVAFEDFGRQTLLFVLFSAGSSAVALPVNALVRNTALAGRFALPDQTYSVWMGRAALKPGAEMAMFGVETIVEGLTLANVLRAQAMIDGGPPMPEGELRFYADALLAALAMKTGRIMAQTTVSGAGAVLRSAGGAFANPRPPGAMSLVPILSAAGARAPLATARPAGSYLAPPAVMAMSGSAGHGQRRNRGKNTDAVRRMNNELSAEVQAWPQQTAAFRAEVTDVVRGALERHGRIHGNIRHTLNNFNRDTRFTSQETQRLGWLKDVELPRLRRAQTGYAARLLNISHEALSELLYFDFDRWEGNIEALLSPGRHLPKSLVDDLVNETSIRDTYERLHRQRAKKQRRLLEESRKRTEERKTPNHSALPLVKQGLLDRLLSIQTAMGIYDTGPLPVSALGYLQSVLLATNSSFSLDDPISDREQAGHPSKERRNAFDEASGTVKWILAVRSLSISSAARRGGFSYVEKANYEKERDFDFFLTLWNGLGRESPSEEEAGTFEKLAPFIPAVGSPRLIVAAWRACGEDLARFRALSRDLESLHTPSDELQRILSALEEGNTPAQLGIEKGSVLGELLNPLAPHLHRLSNEMPLLQAPLFDPR